MSCTRKIRARIAIAKEAFNGNQRPLCGKINKNLRKRLAKCYVWSVALYGAETWTLMKEDEKRLEAFEMWVWRAMEKVRWVDKVRNDEVLRRIGEERRILKVIENKKRNWLGHCLRRDCLLTTTMEGVIEGEKRRRRRRMKLIDSIKTVSYTHLDVYKRQFE